MKGQQASVPTNESCRWAKSLQKQGVRL